MNTKKRHKSCRDEKPKFETYRYWKPKICQNGHKFWVQAYTTIKYNQRQPERPIEPASDRIPKFTGTPEGIRGTPERIPKFCGTPERIRIPAPHLPTETQYGICSQKQFLDSPNRLHQDNRTKMGPNTRIEAIKDIESDILDSLKRLSRFTTDTTQKKLQSMTHDNFKKKHASLPQFKRLCERTIRAARDGQQLAPRSGKDGFYYRLFENFADILKRQHDQILDIKESMENLQDLYEYRQKYMENTFKPVKERPPTPYPDTVGDILRTIDLSLSNSSSRRKTPPPLSPTGYVSSSSSSSKSSTTTTATLTTTVRHRWSDFDDSSSSDSQSD
jgi:hypothetical protein